MAHPRRRARPSSPPAVRRRHRHPPGGRTLTVTPVVSGLAIPWDVAWLPDKTMLFTQRGSGLYALKGGTPVQLTNGGADFWAASETGMMGLAVDPSFATNHKVYTCQGSTADSPIGGHPNSVKVAAWQLDAGVTAATQPVRRGHRHRRHLRPPRGLPPALRPAALPVRRHRRRRVRHEPAEPRAR